MAATMETGWMSIPTDATQKVCEFCGVTGYWVDTGRRWVLVDSDVPGGITPDSLTRGRGLPHWKTCTRGKT